MLCKDSTSGLLGVRNRVKTTVFIFSGIWVTKMLWTTVDIQEPNFDGQRVFNEQMYSLLRGQNAIWSHYRASFCWRKVQDLSRCPCGYWHAYQLTYRHTTRTKWFCNINNFCWPFHICKFVYWIKRCISLDKLQKQVMYLPVWQGLILNEF